MKSFRALAEPFHLNALRSMFSLLIPGILFLSCSQQAVIEGELKKWHTVSLVFEGPATSEMDDYNPFLNYRLDVTFSQGGREFLVPGFYAADGSAAETSAESGNKWMVRFTPDREGEWQYAVSFKKGEGIAVVEHYEDAESGGRMDGLSGSFTIGATDKRGPDNRARGRLEYVGEPYLKFAETGRYFIKTGVDAPENFLAYEDIDATPDVAGRRKDWQPHAKDYTSDAEPYLWQGDRGKNILGAIQYLGSEGLNAFSFLTFNIDGDDRNVFPHLLKVPESEYEAYAGVKKNLNSYDSLVHKTRFDVSKLEQWERILSYGEQQGMFLHFKTHEAETDKLMDGGVFGTEGKLYYRELIARFGHHLALNWNLGEENDQSIAELVKAAEYVHGLDPYKHHLVVHTYPNRDDRYGELIGDQSPLTGASLQLREPDFHDVHPRVLKWRFKSDSAGKPWALAVDEPGNARYALLTDEENPEHYHARVNALYGTLMAGGYGVEWYFGYESPQSDLTCQDFRSRDLFWDQNLHARKLFEEHLPFWEMEPADDLTADEKAWCFAAEDQVFAILLPAELSGTTIDIGNSGREFNISWYDPRNGGALQGGSIPSVTAGGLVSTGQPPSGPDQDWMVILTAN